VYNLSALPWAHLAKEGSSPLDQPIHRLPPLPEVELLGEDFGWGGADTAAATGEALGDGVTFFTGEGFGVTFFAGEGLGVETVVVVELDNAGRGLHRLVEVDVERFLAIAAWSRRT